MRLNLLGLMVVLSLSGCMNNVNTVENKSKTMSPEFVKNKRVVTDGFLDDRLTIMRVDQQALATGLLKVQATVRNTRTGFWSWLIHGDKPYKIAYRFTWYDEAGMVIDTAAGTWLEMDIMPGDIVTISAISPNQRCKDFVLKLKEL